MLFLLNTVFCKIRDQYQGTTIAWEGWDPIVADNDTDASVDGGSYPMKGWSVP